MQKLIPVNKQEDILLEYRQTPIGDLLGYQNLNSPHRVYENAELLIGMCMDNRKQVNIPDNFAYILRTGGGNLRSSEFKVSYAIAIGRVKAIALIAHNCCGMVNLAARKEQFVQGLVENAGWDETAAEEHFTSFAPLFEINNELDFVVAEAERLRRRYAGILVAPLMYRLEDNRLYQIEEHR